jgi:lipid-binding SYLF domain-containing protein
MQLKLMERPMRLFRPTATFLVFALITLTSCRSSGDFGSEPEQLMDRAKVTFQSMMSDGQYPGLLDLSSRAKAIMIVPNLIRAGFFFGGRGGNAVMLVRDDHGWSQPAFYTIGGMSFGLQFGGQSSEMIITVMSERGLTALLDRQVTLGGDAGLAIGELGKGVNAATGLGLKSDLYAFARSEGLFVGVSIEGSVVAPRHTWNQNVYGKDATPRSILIDRTSTGTSASIQALIGVMP